MGKTEDVVGGASTGAVAGAPLGPWGMLGGAVVGGVTGGLLSSDGPKAYDPDPINYRSPTAQGGRYNIVPGTEWGVGKYWNDKAKEYDVDPQTRAVESTRAQQIKAMLNMYNRATQGPSLAGARANAAGEQLMARSQPGVAQGGMGGRNAMITSMGQGRQGADKAMMGEQQERLAALGAYQKGAQGYFGNEADWFGRQAAHKKSKHDILMNFLSQGMMDKSSQANARLRWEQTKMKAQNAAAEAAAAKSGARKQAIGQVVSTGAQVASMPSGDKS